MSAGKSARLRPVQVAPSRPRSSTITLKRRLRCSETASTISLKRRLRSAEMPVYDGLKYAVRERDRADRGGGEGLRMTQLRGRRLAAFCRSPDAPLFSTDTSANCLSLSRSEIACDTEIGSNTASSGTMVRKLYEGTSNTVARMRPLGALCESGRRDLVEVLGERPALERLPGRGDPLVPAGADGLSVTSFSRSGFRTDSVAMPSKDVAVPYSGSG